MSHEAETSAAKGSIFARPHERGALGSGAYGGGGRGTHGKRCGAPVADCVATKGGQVG